MNAKDVQEIAEVCRVLSDPKRLGIMAVVAKGGKSVGELCDKMGLPQPRMSHHLTLMRHMGLLNQVRKGTRMIYSPNAKQLAPLKKFLAKVK